ncbi:uncharacterized protein Dana_GF12629 [Drosophila ananassae]|uniref:Uncharacterized protein n=1 Tax=Drosophila ananassae TaxID=7217 RepID=B3MGL4_DROAN|nr:uncharacterized protein LOC6495478 [Drosophila ananassae]EDV35757.2 uncharacterized protein Dana_GF12629 [Drosophila ananassae]
MNGVRKLRPLKTVRLGDLLYDEQKRLLVLCRSCEHQFGSLQSFHNHLSTCSGVKHIVKSTDELSFDETRRQCAMMNGRQKVYIYDIEAVKHVNDSLSCGLDLEAELENPRWYDNDNDNHKATKSTTAKENVVKDIKLQLHLKPPETVESPPKRQTRSSYPQRKILTDHPQRRKRSSLPSPQAPAAKRRSDTLLVPKVMEDLRSFQESPTKTTRPAQAPQSHCTPKPTPPPMVSIPVDNTQMILNKLRACGVQVKRGNTRLNPTPPADENHTKNNEALEIMRKLQSKGIRCTKVRNT